MPDSFDNDNDTPPPKPPSPPRAPTRDEILRRLQSIIAVDIQRTMSLTTLQVVPPTFRGSMSELLLRQIAANQVTQFRALQEIMTTLIELAMMFEFVGISDDGRGDN